MKFFNNIKTLEQLKKEYHKLVMKHHPDVGGKEELMKEINNEYEKLFDIVKTPAKKVYIIKKHLSFFWLTNERTLR